MIEFAHNDTTVRQTARTKVVGVGGAGCNAINSIIRSGYNDATCIAVNSDAQTLDQSLAPFKVQIGVKSTKGLGAGANPELGRKAAEEDLDKILDAIGQADIVFLTGGMGGGTGSGALPVIAQALRDNDILTIAIVTKPFQFEGKRRAQVADKALEQLRKTVDTLIIIPNQKLLDLVAYDKPAGPALDIINNVLYQSVKSISDIITKPGYINVDFADVQTIMKDMGLAVLGTAAASGENRARTAALEAISSPLLENVSIDGARGVLLNITGGTDLGLHEISEAASIIYERADEHANIILGTVIDQDIHNEIVVTIIATGFNHAITPKNDHVDVSTKASVVELPLPVDSEVTKTASAPAQETASQNYPFHKNLDNDNRKEVSKKQDVYLSSESNDDTVRAIALDDLDVPTFLRKEALQQREE